MGPVTVDPCPGCTTKGLSGVRVTLSLKLHSASPQPLSVCERCDSLASWPKKVTDQP